MGRTFVESHDDVRIQISLNLHRALRTDECRGAVEMVLKMHALFSNLPAAWPKKIPENLRYR